MIDLDALDAVSGMLREESFFLEKHRTIYRAITELHENGEPVDLVTIVSILKDHGELDDIGGVEYLSSITGGVVSHENAPYYARQVMEKHLHRRAIDELRGTLECAYALEPDELLHRMRTSTEMLSDQATAKTDFRRISEVAVESYEDLEKASEAKKNGEVTGIPTGFTDLDRMLAGLQRSDLIILAARPSMGKTALALNIARNVGVEAGETVAMFSLEMGAKQLTNRVITAEGNVDAGRFRTGNIQDDEWDKVTLAIGHIGDAPIFINDEATLTVPEIRAKCRKLKKEHGLGVVLIDYLQLLRGRGRKENRQQEVSEISRDLKQLARELDVTVIALSQLSRGVEQRQDKRPMMSDLRDSGAIEQDADIVAFLYRDDYYDKETDRKNVIEIIIAKQRNGPVGTVELAFLKQYGKFVSLDRGHQEQKPPPPPTDLNKRRWAK